MPGPAPTPTDILKLRGSRLPARRAGEPRPDKGLPVRPRWMNKQERAIWAKIVPELHRIGVLARIDVELISRYCTLAAWWHECREFLARYGKTYPLKAVTVNTTTGETREYIKGFKTHPQVALALDCAVELRRLEQELGLSPSSRARLTIGPRNDTPPVSSRRREIG